WNSSDCDMTPIAYKLRVVATRRAAARPPGDGRHPRLRAGAEWVLIEPRIQSLADAIAQQVEAEHGQEDGDARPQGQPGSAVDVLLSDGQHLAPGGGGRAGRLDTDTEEGEAGLCQNGGRHRHAGLNQERSHRVRQDVDAQDAQMADPERP